MGYLLIFIARFDNISVRQFCLTIKVYSKYAKLSISNLAFMRKREKMNLTSRIKSKCQELNISIRQLEIKSGLTNGQISRWNEKKPSYDKVLSVADILDVSIEWLITGKEPETLTPEEQQLIDAFRAADQRGKRRILQAAETELQEVKSSILPIGSTGTDK